MGPTGAMTPTLTVATMVFNQLELTGRMMATVVQRAATDFEYLMLDNGSSDPVREFMCEELAPRHPRYIRNPENVGPVLGLQQIYEAAAGDIIAVIHNDVVIDEDGWDVRVLRMFEDDPKLGLVSFFGCPGISPDGRRGGLQAGSEIGWSNMRDAERHGIRITEPHAIAVPDGFAMIFRREMLERAGGFDLRYRHHHAYDRAAGLQSLALGYRNKVAPVACHHAGSVTAGGAEYQGWIDGILDESGADGILYQRNEALLARIWGPCLPLYVEEDHSFREVEPFTGRRTGHIVGYDWRAAGA